MSIKLWIIIICLFLIYNTYYETQLFDKLKKYKKHYKIIIIIIMGAGAMSLIKKSPNMTYDNINTLNNFIKVMPIDKNSKDMITPFLQQNTDYSQRDMSAIHKLQTSGKKSTKRCVSETKKKYVASQQNWICRKCNKKLNHTFEVDHVIRLENGGTNEVNNLEALCRECHGQKTAIENF